MTKDIVIVDLWTDTNRGDCALQLGIISLLREKFPSSRISGVFRFGTNEFEDAVDETNFTRAALDESYGGIRNTFYAGDNSSKFSGITHKLISLWSFFEVFIWLLLFKVGLKNLIPFSKKVVIDKISNADIVVWKGKNFRDYGGFAGINRQATLLIAGYISHALNDNVHCVNASVWDMKNPMERFMLKGALEPCKSVTVRERESLKNIQSYMTGASHIVLAQDLSFHTLAQIETNSSGKRVTNSRVALTLTSWGSEEEQEVYVESIVLSLRALYKYDPELSVVVVPQVTRRAEDNSFVIDRVISLLSDTDLNIEVMTGSPSIEELLEAYSSCRMLIGTRMHSCVFARAVGCPFVAIAYDAGAKWDILKEFWPERFVTTYTAQGRPLSDLVSEVYSYGSEFIEASEAAYSKLIKLSKVNVKYVS